MRKIKLNKGFYAIVDNEDYERLANCSWHFLPSASGGGYAIKTCYENVLGIEKRWKVLMHREIMKAPKGMQVDHINRNKLDNRKSNLRLCTHSENLHNMNKHKRNTSGFKGVYAFRSIWKTKNKWVSRISVNGKNISLGYFSNKKEAAMEYDKAALKYYGEFALLNFRKKPSKQAI